MSRRRAPAKRLLLALGIILAIVFAAIQLSTTAGPTGPSAPGSAAGPGAAQATPAPPAPAPPAPAPSAPGETPGPTGADPSAAAALATVTALPGATYTDDGSYAGHRDDLFGDAWALDFDGNGCDTRNDILARDLTATTAAPGRCTIATGTLADPYTGESISFARGADSSSAVQIDHLLPLKAVYATGGEAWTPQKRESLANDPINLLAVKGSENSSKSDSLPSDWLPGFYPDVSDRHDLGQRVAWDDLPADTSLQCWYVETIVPVFVAYELGVTAEDRAAMTAVLQSC